MQDKHTRTITHLTHFINMIADRQQAGIDAMGDPSESRCSYDKNEKRLNSYIQQAGLLTKGNQGEQDRMRNKILKVFILGKNQFVFACVFSFLENRLLRQRVEHILCVMMPDPANLMQCFSASWRSAERFRLRQPSDLGLHFFSEPIIQLCSRYGF